MCLLTFYHFNPIISNYYNNIGEKYTYSIDVDECYNVYAIAMINNELHYLLIGNLGYPQFYKVKLFEIVENDIYDLNTVKTFDNEFISYLITNDYLSNIETIKKIIRKDDEELLKFYNYIKIKKI
ncbi:MAG TPA: hypothetical protein DCR62_04470 [Acholeplasmatales bacterium]|jgi:hypothetical protein|nr:hypothetical protein [Staphylococcus sp.]CDC70012.1 unknown [Staphylococcus sp. CAG:324]HAR57979.1 hypothetical protein [Acholeplasmatales bacterium]